MEKSFLLAFLTLLSLQMYGKDSCRSGNCTNGFGTLVADSYSYTGTFKSGMFHGKGKMVFSNGSKYDGAFNEGYMEGVGEYRYQEGHVYNGQFIKNKRSGKGRMKYASGDEYKGDWRSDLMHGIGEYRFKDGSLYKGEFKKNMFSGNGAMFMTDGKVLKGEWEDNKLVNQVETASNDVPSLKNCNKVNCHNTTGKYTYKDGTVFTGEFLNGKPTGKGKAEYQNGSVYMGEWTNGAPNGIGKLTTRDGKSYQGRWEDGKLMPPKKTSAVTNKPSYGGDKDGVTTIYSLVVGIANYQTMPSLKYTDDDAYQFFAFVKSPEGGAVEDKNVVILVDDAATSVRIVSELRKIAARADADDEIMVYFSGHGLDGGFVPYDYGHGASIISYQSLLQIIDASPAKNKICFADACYSGSMAARKPYLVGLEEFYSKLNGSRPGTALLMSSMNEEVSLEYSGLRQGIFSHYLIKGLKGAANANNDRIVTVAELYNYVSARVRAYTQNMQNPNIAGQFDESMPVAFLR